MDFTFNDDQLAFREAISRFLMTEAAPEMLRDVWETDAGRSPSCATRSPARASPPCRCPSPAAAWAWTTWPGR